MEFGIQDEIAQFNLIGALKILLADKTTGSNIIWATDTYESEGELFNRDREITPELVTFLYGSVIKNRTEKDLSRQSERTRKRAEVFTPLWICKKMIDYIDDDFYRNSGALLTGDLSATLRSAQDDVVNSLASPALEEQSMSLRGEAEPRRGNLARTGESPAVSPCTPPSAASPPLSPIPQSEIGDSKRVCHCEEPTGDVAISRERQRLAKAQASTQQPLWQAYVTNRRLEITCGEAPYLVSRYDVSTGERIPIENRIGILDRKLRLISQNVSTQTEWLNWVVKAYQATYGYEFQGDSLLIARVNLLATFVEYYEQKWNKPPDKTQVRKIANIIAWNIWQMDGLNCRVPYCKTGTYQMSIFETARLERYDEKQPLCRIKNWNNQYNVYFNNLSEGKGKMKFDYIIGNPPYQEKSSGDKLADDSVYHLFMDASYVIGNIVELITPARFLFNNGNTPTAWNKKMLNDEHLKVLDYWVDSSAVFSSVDIKGGVAITFRNASENYGAIKTYTAYAELNSILSKVMSFICLPDESLIEIIYNQNKFNLNNLYMDFPELRNVISSDGRERRMTSGCLKYDCFHDQKVSDNDIQIIGLINNKRVKKYLNRKYLEEPNENIDKFKVIVPANNGSGAIGEVLSTPLIGLPLIGLPLIGHTQTFISIGKFDTESEAKACLKYVKSKFARTMLGVLKVTQNGKREMWKYVPLQDFTEKSDIDWSKSVAEIDRQLYAKYGLDEREISFIESKVKEMV